MSTVAVVWGSLEIMMFAGIIFGWHNIVYIYKDQGYFSHLCPVSNITENAIKSRSDCNEQDEQFNIIFSLSTFITGIMCIFTGALYDRFGTRKYISTKFDLGAKGSKTVSFIFSTHFPGQPYFLYPGFIFTTYGGYFLLITNLQIAGLVPNYRSMIMSAYCGSYDVSATMFLFFKLSYENYDISPNTCFIVMAVVYCVVYGFSTFCILPKSRIPMPKPSKYQFRPHELTEEKTTLVNEEDSKTNENIVSNGHPSTIQSTTRVPTFKKVLLSPLFLFLVFWISVHRLRGWMFIGVFNPWMSRLVCGDRSIVSHFTSFLSSTMFIGIFSAAFSGFVMDRKIKKKYESRKFGRIHASIASFLLNCSVGLLLSICMTIPVVNLQYLTCLLFTLHRSFLYGPNSAFIANAFPMEHFGKLIGVTLTVSSLFGMLQNPLFLWIQGPLDKDPLVVNVIICVMILLTFIHPTYIWFYLRKKFSSRQKEKN
ncbi:hypothetical protein LOTGIDRAFT_114888 [Lottia gigantea]|uniref:Solute carrier family 43 member 3 n=1 Tax=Lottia gigantea TaxID=225164 RepID=V4C6V7_LOTGI|nr:hypothetical protein LOTGIDRAFT_114888 [Lottia gigantea]ESO97379.1 hypothetical protein LOTGIDRAFT_114888 [Lottia gigantea]